MLNWFRRDRDAETVEAEEATTQGAPVDVDELAEEALAAAPEDELAFEEQEEEREASLESSLEKTRGGFFSHIKGLFSRGSEVTEDFYEELEELLIQADVGVMTTQRLIEALRERVEAEGIRTIDEAHETFQDEMAGFLADERVGLKLDHPLNLMLVVGVNQRPRRRAPARLRSERGHLRRHRLRGSARRRRRHGRHRRPAAH
jgi:fused signal recognition particle receptor